MVWSGLQRRRTAFTWLAVRIVTGKRPSSLVWFQFILVRARISSPRSFGLRSFVTGRIPIGCGTYIPGYVE